LCQKFNVNGFHPESLIVELQEKARALRLDSTGMICQRQAGHPGGSLSAADIGRPFRCKMHLDLNGQTGRNGPFILSKGACVGLLYAALARRGFFPPMTSNDGANWTAICKDTRIV
jgi:transketolase